MSTVAVPVGLAADSYSYEKIKKYLDELRGWTELCLRKMPKKFGFLQ